MKEPISVRLTLAGVLYLKQNYSKGGVWYEEYEDWLASVSEEQREREVFGDPEDSEYKFPKEYSWLKALLYLYKGGWDGDVFGSSPEGWGHPDLEVPYDPLDRPMGEVRQELLDAGLVEVAPPGVLEELMAKREEERRKFEEDWASRTVLQWKPLPLGLAELHCFPVVATIADVMASYLKGGSLSPPSALWWDLVMSSRLGGRRGSGDWFLGLFGGSAEVTVGEPKLQGRGN